MNAQRWIALGIVILIGISIATSDIWLGALLKDDEESAPTPPNGTITPGIEITLTVSTQGDINATAQPTIDPIVVELMAETGIGALGVGDEPFITMAGDFVTIDTLHRADGVASIYQIGDVKRALRLDPFSVVSGPDLHVLFSQHPSPRTSSETLLPEYVDLGQLKGVAGAQNYDIPDGVDLSKYKSVVIYSISLNLVFSTATLEQVRG